MTLRLILMRHAQSAPSAEGALSDHERPLTQKGRDSIRSQASLVQDAGWKPELVYVSDARRTRETAELFVPHFDKPPSIKPEHELYLASPGQIISYLIHQTPSAKTIQIIGHNPTMESLLEHLALEFQEFKPASVALLEHSARNWEDALGESGSWKLVQFLSAI